MAATAAAAAVAVVEVAVTKLAMMKRILMGCAWLTLASPVWALDADIQFHIQARQAQVAPLCAALIARTGTLPPEASFQKAICLQYGLQTPANPDEAIKLLRALALDGMTEAQLALADILQQGDAVQQKEAVQWYGRAAAAGDVRAGLRQSRLAQRIQAAEDAAKAATTPEADDPYADGLNNAARQPGYHCHMYGFGKKICHGGMD